MSKTGNHDEKTGPKLSGRFGPTKIAPRMARLGLFLGTFSPKLRQNAHFCAPGKILVWSILQKHIYSPYYLVIPGSGGFMFTGTFNILIIYFSLVLENVFQPGVTKCIAAWCYKMHFSLVLQNVFQPGVTREHGGDGEVDYRGTHR